MDTATLIELSQPFGSVEIFMRLIDRVAIITAGTSKVGLDLTRTFVREGGKVLFVDTDAVAGRALEAELGDHARFLAEDLTACGMADRIVAAARAAFGGRIDILANLACGDASALLGSAGYDVELMVGRGLWTTFHLMQACRPALAVARGSIINFASAANSCGQVAGANIIMAGEGVWGMTRDAAHAWRADGIRVNLAIPAPIPVEFNRNCPSALNALNEGPPIAVESDDETPVSDLARIALFLANDTSIGLTGMMLTPDGRATSLGCPV